MYDKQQFKDWYEKTKPQRKTWQKEYYQKHKEHILEVHKDWAKRNVDQTGSVWRKYGRWARIRNPNIDKEYRLRKKTRLMYNHLKKGSFHLHPNFLEHKLFEKLKSDLPTLKYKATYQPHNTYYGNRFQAYPCYELYFPTHNHIIIPKLEALLQKEIDIKSFVCIARKTVTEELQRSKANAVYGMIHQDPTELATVLYFDQTTSGGTIFFEQHWDKHPDISVGAYPNRLILYDAKRWHATATDFTFKERYVLAMFFNTEKSKRDINV